MSNLVVLIPIIVFFAATFLVFAVYQSQARKRQVMRARLAHYDMTIGVSSFPSLSSGLLRENRLSSIRAMDQMLGWGGWGDKMALDLARAAIPLRVGEYVLIRWLMALTLFIVGGFLGGSMVAGFLLAIGGYFFPRLYVSLCEKKRVKAFDDQLIDSLSLMANSLRSGFGLLQGLEAVAREMPAPIADEFGRVLHEMRVGGSIEEALANLTGRVRSADLDLMVTAMVIQRTVGGNLAEILDSIAHTIRERIRLLRQVTVLTAQERFSAYILGALPVVMLVVISLANPSYIDMLFWTTVGRLMLAVAFGLEVVGFIICRKIMSIEV